MSNQVSSPGRIGLPLDHRAVRRAEPCELATLVRALGQPRHFRDSLARQRAGRGALLVAWLDRIPIGSVYLRTEPADERELRSFLPGVPLLNRLEVRERYRNRGIGTALLHEAERLLEGWGHRRVALAVEISNVDAIRLYLRLGYRDWGYSQIVCDCELPPPGGGPSHETETCYVLVKSLRTGVSPTTRHATRDGCVSRDPGV